MGIYSRPLNIPNGRDPRSDGPGFEVGASASGGGFSSCATYVSVIDLIPDDVLEAIRLRVAAKCEQVRAEMDAPREPRPPKSDLPSNLYLMRSLGLHKIGVSRNVEARRGEISRMSGHPVEVVAFARGSSSAAYRAETEWHAYFAAKRRHGEWFDLSPEDVSMFALALRGGTA